VIAICDVVVKDSVVRPLAYADRCARKVGRKRRNNVVSIVQHICIALGVGASSRRLYIYLLCSKVDALST
jgi:hypothetical protein